MEREERDMELYEPAFFPTRENDEDEATAGDEIGQAE